MPTSIAFEPVTLNAGFVVSLNALRLLWQLEARGCQIEREGDHLTVAPRELVSAGDRERIRAHRDELLALVDYTERRGWEM